MATKWKVGTAPKTGKAPSPSIIAYVDHAVRAKLPHGCEVSSITPHGQSFYGRTAKLKTKLLGGGEQMFFLKVHQGDQREALITSEFRAMTAFNELMPDFAPKPLAYGHYASEPDAWFLLSEFRELVDEVPDVEDFPELLARLHLLGARPGGQFGWALPVFSGFNGRSYPLCDTWEETFTRGFRHSLELEHAVQAVDEEGWDEIREAFLTRVLPRLLRPMETGGRRIVPTCVHGDLWDGNVSVDAATGNPIIFDPTAMYAHHEFDFSPWHCPRMRIGPKYAREYLRHRPASEPQEDFPDRMLLYAAHFDIQASINIHGCLRRRHWAKERMVLLLEKYPGGYEEWARDHGEEPSPSPFDKSSADLSDDAEPQDLVVPVSPKAVATASHVEILSQELAQKL